ncbi:hypothetical protein DFH07DRAFT_777793 [Mycena maculata]|uniref:Uncharacterized protein n=1 Tax=Mycena maculata TaxID=230809 RepID=A0AAD7N226_9AGAR|nr:hypothetical protein DFH07DRAFT_777793 [Mycena maculata]
MAFKVGSHSFRNLVADNRLQGQTRVGVLQIRRITLPLLPRVAARQLEGKFGTGKLRNSFLGQIGIKNKTLVKIQTKTRPSKKCEPRKSEAGQAARELRASLELLYGKEVSPELENTMHILTGTQSIIFNVEAMKWALRVHNIPFFQSLTSGADLWSLQYFLDQFKVIPDLDQLGLTDYLFCVTSFLSPVGTSDIVWMDKSQFQVEVLEHFF